MTDVKNDKIYVAGHNGMVGGAIVRKLNKLGYKNVIVRSRKELDLINQSEVIAFFEKEKPNQVYLAAAKVGGIGANSSKPAEFIYENLMIETNIIHAAFKNGTKKLLFLGSSCIYPKLAPQPISEDMLLTSQLEPTNEPYAISKIAGIKLCESYNRQYGEAMGIDYRSVMPTNLYGPGDNYHLENAHVIPTLIRRFHEAKINGDSQVDVWGTGNPKREFLHVDDVANACVHVMNLDKSIHVKSTDPMCSHYNVGTGVDLTIRELAETIKNIVGFKGDIIFDTSKPDGVPRKLLDSSKLTQIGWEAQISLQDGLSSTYEDFKELISSGNIVIR